MLNIAFFILIWYNNLCIIISIAGKRQRSLPLMKIKLFSRMINEQLEFLLPKAFLADLLVFIAALPFYGFDYRLVLGLLLGTAAMTANIILLGYSAERAVERSSAKRAKRYMFSFYLLRMTVMGAAIALGFNADCFNPVCTFLPLLWPKVLYTGSAITQRKK